MFGFSTITFESWKGNKLEQTKGDDERVVHLTENASTAEEWHWRVSAKAKLSVKAEV